MPSHKELEYSMSERVKPAKGVRGATSRCITWKLRGSATERELEEQQVHSRYVGNGVSADASQRVDCAIRCETKIRTRLLRFYNHLPPSVLENTGRSAFMTHIHPLPQLCTPVRPFPRSYVAGSAEPKDTTCQWHRKPRCS